MKDNITITFKLGKRDRELRRLPLMMHLRTCIETALEAEHVNVPVEINVLVTDDDKAADLTGLIIGVVLLLACLNVISFEILWKMILPVILVFIGAALIFGKTEVKFFSRDSSHKDYKKSTKKIKEAKIKK